MRLAIREIENLFKEIEASHNIKPSTLSKIYKAEARVVFLGKRRNIIPDLRKIVIDALLETGCSEA